VPPSLPPRPKTFFDQFKGLRWWELVLVFIPLLLVVLGGLVGGIMGAIGLLANLAIARRRLSSGVKVAAMIGVIVVAFVVVYLIAVVLYASTHKT
jgi:hypothetical protein